MSCDTIDLSKKRFMVSIYEVHQEIVFAEQFSGRYTKSATLSDGTTRTVELTPVVHDGRLVIEFKDNGHRSFTHLIPVRTGGQTNGTLMVRIFDMDDIDTARAEWRSRLPQAL
jgi:hypothetical protein